MCGHCGSDGGKMSHEGHGKMEGMDHKDCKNCEHSAHEMKKAEGEAVILEGEIVDLGCWMSHGGKEAPACTEACLKGGKPAGLKTKGGKVYLLLQGHGPGQEYRKAVELGGKMAEIKGKKITQGGLAAVYVERTRKLKN